jgi:hypothetical protein
VSDAAHQASDRSVSPEVEYQGSGARALERRRLTTYDVNRPGHPADITEDFTMSTTPAAHVTGSTRVASARSQVRALLCVAISLALLLLAVAAYMWEAEATYDGESLGLGYALAILAAIPAAVALLLSLTAFLLRRRFAVTAAVLAWCAAVTAVAPIALVALLSLINY